MSFHALRHQMRTEPFNRNFNPIEILHPAFAAKFVGSWLCAEDSEFGRGSSKVGSALEVDQ
jgi:hypothetical protein